jgi:hypothetical protein
MSKHIPAREQPLKAPPHSGSSPVAPPRAPKAGPGAGPSPGPATDLDPPSPTDEQIAVRAYEIWLEKGKPDGTELENWAEAERQLRRHVVDPQKDTTPIQPSR